MTKNGNGAKKALALSASVALLGSMAITGLAGAGIFEASADVSPDKLLRLETIDEFATHGYKIEVASKANESAEHPYDDAEHPYDYVITTVDKTTSWWNPRGGSLYFEENSHEAVWNITTPKGVKVTGGGAYKWSKVYTATSTDDTISSFTVHNNEKIIYPDTGDRADNGDDWKCGETVMTFSFKEGSGDNDCTTHGERVPCTCWTEGAGQGESLVGMTLRVLYRIVHIEDHEFTFTGASTFDEENENVMFLNFGPDVLGVSTADESWNHAQRFMSSGLSPFFRNIYYLEGYDATNGAPTTAQLEGRDLYSLMTGENNTTDGLLFETHLRYDHIEIGLLARDGADSEAGAKVNYKAGDAFYLAQGLEMLGKDGNTNWCIASEGGSKNILARNQLYTYNGESWSSDEYSISIDLDKTKAKAEVDGATDTITAQIVTGALAGEAGEVVINWSSSDENIATVAANGASCVITGVSAGTATITAELENGAMKTCTVTVVEATEITGVKLNKSNNFTVYTSGEENTFQLVATVEGGSKAPQTVTWTVADPTIASVDANGLVTGLKKGSTKITCTAADGTTTATVNVNVKEAAVVDPGNDDDDKKDDDKKDNKGCGSAVSGSIAAAGVALVAAGAVIVVARKKSNNK